MAKKILPLLVVFMVSFVASASRSSVCDMGVSPVGTEFCINGAWRFHYAPDARHADSIARCGFGSLDYDVSSFDTILVPSCWSVLGYEEPVYREFKTAPHSEGFYVRRFVLPQSFVGKRVTLNFGGVWASAEVWLNGCWIGRHDSGYTSFSMPVTGIAKAGEENVLAVRVRQVYPEYVTDTYDDWSFGGIYRDVTFTCTPSKMWLEQVTVVTDFDDAYKDASLKVSVMVYDNHKSNMPGNYRPAGPEYQLRYTLIDTSGRTVFDELRTQEGHPGNGRLHEETFCVKSPLQWNAETPNLYTLNVALVENGTTRQCSSQRIGFREISTVGGIFRINGQPVTLRGVNRHDEWPDVGRATRPEHWLKDLQMMKEHNINFVRACHYQHAKGFIEMCDSIGMYVGAEVSLGGAGSLMDNPQFVPGMMLRTFETIKRDINNPCIVYWSVGNEDSFNQMYYDAAKVTKTLDPTRPVLYPWCADLHLPSDIDILAPHYWTSYEYDSLCAVCDRPVITTEYVHAYGVQRFGGLEQCFKALRDSPRGAGGAIWMWADQGVVTPTEWVDAKYRSLSKGDRHLRISGEGWDGITDSYRNPTRDSEEAKNVYAYMYPLTDADGCVKVRGRRAVIPIHNDHDFISSKDYVIRYKVFVDGAQRHEGTASLDIAPHSEKNLIIEAPIDGMEAWETAYVQLMFERNGMETSRKWVLLRGGSAEAPAGRTATFTFNDGFPEGMRPTIWHRMNEGDNIIRGKINGEKYSLRVTKTERTERKDGYVVITEAECEINDSNSFRGTYCFIVNEQQGTMDVEYSIMPHITSGRYVPLAGMALKARPHRWLGLGPDEAYPNKKAAEILGVWDATALEGTRAARWVETDRYRITFLNEGDNYGFGYSGYIDRDWSDSDEVRLCSHILGRSEKGRLNDRNYRMEPTGGTYSGKLRITSK